MWSDLTFAPPPPPPPSKSNNGSLALVYCLSGEYKFASVLRCVSLVYLGLLTDTFYYVVTLRRGRTRPHEQLLLQNYKA